MDTNAKVEQKFTPGPWFPVNYAGYILIQGQPVYGAPDLLKEDECKEALANGELASKAPKLFELVKKMRQDLYEWDYSIGDRDTNALIQEADALIAEIQITTQP